MPDLSAGARIGRFVVVKRLGQGGMGTVVEARDPELGRSVALKLLRDERGDTVRMLREAQALASLSHPNVIAVHDLGTHEGAVFIAMELADGVTLDRWLSEKRRSWREILDVFVQAGRGLAAVHERGMVHRDFKPSNVLVDRTGRARLGDFGLVSRDLSSNAVAGVATPDSSPSEADEQPPPFAEDATHALATPLTRTGAVLGTPRYMAPEQHRGARATHRADQFAFCVALWEALFRTHPFSLGSVAELRLSIESGRLRRGEGRGVPSWLDRALIRGLGAEPAERWPNMSALLDVLERKPTGMPRRRVLAGLASGGLVVAGGAASLAWWRRAAAIAPIRPTRLAIVPGSGWAAVALAEALAVHLADVAWIAPAEVVARIAREHDDPMPIEALRAGLAVDAVLGVVPGAVRLHAIGRGHGVVIDEPIDEGIHAAARRIAARVRVVVAAAAAEIDATWSLPARPEVVEMYAEGLARAYRYDPIGARERLSEVARQDPTFCRGQLVLARVLEVLGADERIAVARVARDLAAALPATVRHAAITKSYEIERDWARGAEAAAAWLAQSADSLDAAISLAKNLAWVNDHDQAKRVIANARTLARCEEDLVQVDLAAYRVAERRRDYAAARASAEDATTRARVLGATLLVAFARRCEARALVANFDFEAAVAAAGEAKALDAAMGNRSDVLISLSLLGSALQSLGHLTSAKAAHEEAIADSEMLGALRLPGTLANLGAVQLSLGDLAGARTSLERALALYPSNLAPGAKYFQTFVVLSVNLVELDLRAGRLEAVEARLAGLPAPEDVYDRLIGATFAARLRHARDQLDAARQLLEQVLALEASEEDRVDARMALARVLLDAGAGADALPHVEAAIAVLRAHERDLVALADGVRAECLRAAGRAADAAEAEARLLARAQDSEHVEVLTAAALVRARAGDVAPARAQLADARSRGDVTRALELAVAIEPDAAAIAEAERLGLALIARHLRESAR